MLTVLSAIYGTLVVWFLAACAGVVAHRKGRSWLLFGLVGLLLPGVGVVIAYRAAPGDRRLTWNRRTATGVGLMAVGSTCVVTAAFVADVPLAAVGIVGALVAGPMLLVAGLWGAEQALRPPLPQPGNWKVLVVDDDPDAVAYVTAVMEESGCRVISASDGEEGLQKAAGQMPDVVILDLMMPVRGGYDTFAQMRRTPGLSKIPVVMLTGADQYTDGPLSSTTVRLGVGQAPEAFVKKPIDAEQLRQTVVRAVTEEPVSRQEAEQPAPTSRRLPWPAGLGRAAGCLTVLAVALFVAAKAGLIGAHFFARREAFAAGKTYFIWPREEAEVEYQELSGEDAPPSPDRLALLPVRYEVNPDREPEPFLVRLRADIAGYPDRAAHWWSSPQEETIGWAIGAPDRNGLRSLVTTYYSQEGDAFAVFVSVAGSEHSECEAVVDLTRPDQEGEPEVISNELTIYVAADPTLKEVAFYSSHDERQKARRQRKPIAELERAVTKHVEDLDAATEDSRDQ